MSESTHIWYYMPLAECVCVCVEVFIKPPCVLALETLLLPGAAVGQSVCVLCVCVCLSVGACVRRLSLSNSFPFALIVSVYLPSLTL